MPKVNSGYREKNKAAYNEIIIKDIKALSDIFVSQIENCSPKLNPFERMHTERITERLKDGNRHPQIISPKRLKATSYWPAIIDRMSSDQGSEMRTILKRLTPLFKWKHHSSYNAESCSKDFLDNFSLTELIGEDGLCFSRQVTLGIFLIGPDTYYPLHSHNGSECLYLLSGRGTWRLANGPTISLPHSSTVFIPSEVTHAFWSYKEPMAAIYACPGIPKSNMLQR